MSRLANVPIKIPSSVTVTVENKSLSISNGKVTEKWALHSAVNVALEDDSLVFTMKESDKKDAFCRAMLGTDYRHISNLVTGMAKPFETVLEIHGLGYRVKMSGNQLVLSLGKSHDDIVDIVSDVAVEMTGEKEIVCRSHSKKKLGDFVAEVCSKRRPDAYKAKGVRIRGVHYRTKSD
ncbi:50S ribosomal protein L6 [Candidatus Synchoanobacter obligatus]|uniref:50S ribosomal protein L6 n=1 Tax=Candidatus Synchoanobacter obligatus TaxID=2919597 RepID=A0ABT1L6I2_9GAMM|nr:50S ribosomal protein L6 [Candidatus Synchoanobacter obligatus]MCP8352501.1 50S ribosomal protein L6 [Candidatus Synchoanobacter obligatus]